MLTIIYSYFILNLNPQCSIESVLLKGVKADLPLMGKKFVC